MEKTQKAVIDYYNGNLRTTSSFENKLKEIPKEDLIDFIMTMQCRGCFKNICY